MSALNHLMGLTHIHTHTHMHTEQSTVYVSVDEVMRGDVAVPPPALWLCGAAAVSWLCHVSVRIPASLKAFQRWNVFKHCALQQLRFRELFCIVLHSLSPSILNS